MEKNFTVEISAIEVTDRAGRVYDIHNCYDFNGIQLNSGDGARLEIQFAKSKGEWVSENDPEYLTFLFDGLMFLEISKEFFQEELSCIGEIGYKEPGDIDDSFMLEERFTGEQHIIFRFEGTDHYIRAFAQKIDLIVKYD